MSLVIQFKKTLTDPEQVKPKSSFAGFLGAAAILAAAAGFCGMVWFSQPSTPESTGEFDMTAVVTDVPAESTSSDVDAVSTPSF